MFKVEIEFDSSNLTTGEMEKLCEQVDQIFENEDLDCVDRQLGSRVYLGRGRKQDYGRFWAAIFALKSTESVSRYLKECFWYNGNDKENLITEFMRK